MTAIERVHRDHPQLVEYAAGQGQGQAAAPAIAAERLCGPAGVWTPLDFDTSLAAEIAVPDPEIVVL